MFPFVESLLDRVFFGFTLAPAFDISASCTHTNKCTYAVVNDYGFFEDTKKKKTLMFSTRRELAPRKAWQ